MNLSSKIFSALAERYVLFVKKKCMFCILKLKASKFLVPKPTELKTLFLFM